MSVAEQEVTVSLADQVTELVHSGAVQLPPLPELTVKLQQLLADEDRADAQRVAALIQAEPAMTAELLRIANSAAFGGLSEIKGLQGAIARLGLSQVGSIVTALQVKGHFADKASSKNQLLSTIWDHSVTTAFGARILAQRVAADAEEAFLAGLLHDCGELLVLKAVDLLEKGKLKEPLSDVVLRELMRSLHTTLGHHVLQGWNVPAPIPFAALHHEDSPEKSEDLLLICVQTAILITQKIGFHLDPDPEIDLLQEPTVEHLGLKDVELATLMCDMEDELEEVHKLF